MVPNANLKFIDPTQAATVKESLEAGDYFGEMALLGSELRMATVTAKSRVCTRGLANSVVGRSDVLLV